MEKCSTPGGVIGIGTVCPTIWGTRKTSCSTPGGVIGIGTLQIAGAVLSLACAQRLAASLESALSPIRERYFFCVCVLNAWRRHWNRHEFWAGHFDHCPMCSTPGGVIGIGTRRTPIIGHSRRVSAQRLAASLESAHRETRHTIPRVGCAQRLAASLESAPSLTSRLICRC